MARHETMRCARTHSFVGYLPLHPIHVAICALFAAAAAPAVADTHTWTDAAVANNFWSEAGNWSPSGQPSTGDVAIVPTPGAGVGPVVVNVQTLSIAQLQVADNAGNPQVQILADKSLVFGGGDLLNDGLIVVNSDGGNQTAKIRFAASGLDNLHTISGDGTILLQAGPQLISPMPALIETASSHITHEAGHTIRGVGRITASMTNNGTIIADNLPALPGDNRLELVTGGINNNGLLSALTGGTLDIVGTYVVTQGASGVIRADGGIVLMRNLAVVQGGTLESTGAGVIRTSSGTTQLFEVTNDANYEISNNATTRVNGSGLTNNGQVKVIGTLDYLLSGALDGSGEVWMSSAGSIFSTQTGVNATQGPSHTIRGVGQLNAALISNGTVRADGGTLRVTFWAKTNNHEMRAAAGSTLQIETEVTQDPNTGLVIAENGGIVKLNFSNSRVNEGRLQSIGTGLFQAENNAQLWDLHNQATIEVRSMTGPGNMSIRDSGLTNDGTIVVNPAMQGGAFTISFCCAPQMTLDGGGVIDLNHTNSNLIVAGGTTLTNAAGHTIKGPGIIDGVMVNQGTVSGGTIAGPVDIIRVAGRLSGSGDLSDVRFTGVHAPGNGVGHVDVGFSYEIAAGGKLELEIGGTPASNDFDSIDVTGYALLAGTIDVDLVNGYIPSGGDSYQFLSTTTGLNGAFTTETLPALAGGLFFDVQYGTHDVTLAVEGILGDYNRNGIVDGADYVVWRKTFGQTGFGLAADGNNSGEVELRDLSVWRANFGQTAPGSGSASSGNVPEPATVVMFLIGMMAMFLPTRGRVITHTFVGHVIIGPS